MRLVYRDTKIVVNFIINNFIEGSGDKGIDRVASDEVR